MRTVRASTLGFDALMTVLLSLAMGGFFSDLWAHSHGRVETFFTIWHLALYTASGLVFLVLAIVWARGRRSGATVREALPDGYGLSFAGAIVFMLGGVLDFLWHLAFGIEANVSALFSPTHILLFAAGLLMVSGPLRAAWRRGDGPDVAWLRRLPMVISIALVLSVLTAMTQFISPIVDTFAEAPAGQSLVFSEIYTMNADGSRQTRLITRERAHVFGPLWSPDGTKLAFASGTDAGYEVVVANADGTGSRPLTAAANGSSFPGSWSPDGSQLLITVGADAGNRIESVGVNGSQRTRLSSGAYNDAHPTFSPDGAKIVFASDRDGRYQVYVMRSDGTGVTQLTRGDADSWGPSWSPDGRRVAFNSDRSGRQEIYVMNGDGSDQRQLTHATAGASWQPVWSPDGRRIAFGSDRDAQQEIYVVDADGSGEANLTRSPGLEESSPSWSRDGLIAYQAGANLSSTLVPDTREKLGLAAILVQSALIAGVALLALRRGGLPFGGLTIIFGINTALMSVLSDQYRLIPGALVAGIASDLLVWRLRPSAMRPIPLGAASFFIPASVVAANLITLAFGRGIGWPIHLWTGSVLLAGFVGILLWRLLDEPQRTAMSQAPPD
jgi:TolB protein